MIELVNLELLRVFEALSQERNVSRAARRLGLAQSSVSGALARLRTQLGDELFVRSGGEMVPTAVATEIAPGILRALEQLRAALDRPKAFDPSRAVTTFTVGSTDYTSFVMLGRLVQDVARRAPGVTLRLVEYEKDEVASLVSSNRIDVAIGVFRQLPGGLGSIRLWSDSFVGVCRPRHPRLEMGRMSLTRYVAEKHALVSVRGDKTGEVDRVLAARRLRRDVSLVVPHMMALTAALRATDLVAAVPARAATRFLEEGLVSFPLPFPMPRWSVQMAWNLSRRREPAHAFLRDAIKLASRSVSGART